MKNILTLCLASAYLLFVVSVLPAQSVEVRDTNHEALIIIHADSSGGFLVNAYDAGGGLSAYSSTFPSPFTHFADRTSLWSSFVTASGLDIRADGLASDIRFYAGGFFADNERMRITPDGKIGIGTSYPLEKLDVNGMVRATNAAGTAISGAGSSTGVYGSGHSYGVYGYGYSSAPGVYFSGGLSGTGTKNAIVKTTDGPKAVYCQESAENWFEDFGSGMIENGFAQISVALDFLQTVTIDGTHPMKVFVTPNANLGNWWVEKRNAEFVVHAPNATDGALFDYRIVAKRKGFETVRLEPFENAYTDRYLYPTVDEVPDAYKEKWLKANVRDPRIATGDPGISQ